MRWQDYHCIQSRLDSCVPACAAMATAWAEQRPDAATRELEWISRLLVPDYFGTTLDCLRPFGFFYRYERDASESAADPVTASVLALLELELALRPVLVTVLPGPLLRDHWTMRGPLGPLVQSPDQPLPWHSVLLVATERDGRELRYLDPFFGPEDQPFSISRGDFANAWTGHRAYLQR